MMTPRLNQVPSQLRSLPYRPRSSFIPLTKALPEEKSLAEVSAEPVRYLL
jgi:hypothetical protein